MNADGRQTISAPAPTAAVKFYNFSSGAPSLNFYADGNKLTAVSSTSGSESNSGTAFGSGRAARQRSGACSFKCEVPIPRPPHV